MRDQSDIHATPTVRALARELGVDLSQVTASGPNGRILREDVQRYVKDAVSGRNAPAISAMATTTAAPMPLGEQQSVYMPATVDFAKFGAVERKPLSRVQRISGVALHKSWSSIPHVTNFDEADITGLEDFRGELNDANAGGIKLTALAFLMKAAARTLRAFPEINASLDGDTMVLKKYVNIGVAVDTPNGLVVPVVRDCDTKGVLEMAKEVADLANRARQGKLKGEEMQGGSFSISSLGALGGTGFTPIINAPEIAILGVGRSEMKPKWNGTAFEPRLMVPVSLSWDHRAIDGGTAARFLTHLVSLLADLRRINL
ncbi:MAG TPA: 2-oxo acid dehydrogenase subunit E2 [Hyphomicrobiaceae bacterium]|nr:2-oxo acid dehydrogenase subunit E2 [Hyphomicrobiaceae bacterium]